MQLTDTVEKIHNIGEQRLKYLNNVGVFTVEDLIEHFPRDYDDRTDVKTIDMLVVGQANTFKGKIVSKPETIRIRAILVTTVKVSDDTGIVYCTWYNQRYLSNAFKVGEEYYFTGSYQIKYNKKQIISPEYEAIDKDELLSSARIMPIYSTTKSMSQKVLRALIKDTLDKTKNQMVDFIPQKVRMENQLCDKNFAVLNIHFPENDEAFFIARRRLVFEELFVLQTALFKIKSAIKGCKEGCLIVDKNNKKDEVTKQLGFDLTDAQKKVTEEILSDFASGLVMNRLVQGDVGSGKTAVAMITSYIAISCGYQATIMAPTEVLAKQHFENFKKLFNPLGVEVAFLSGSMKKSEKNKASEDIAEGTAKMVVGTHAVIQESVQFKNLGLVITDEQHRFGVNQRVLLSKKGSNPHILVMTATPIPRTLALILDGDLDISIIDSLPPGRQKVETRAVNKSYRDRIYDFIKKEISRGRQVYMVCPSIDESDKRETESVLTYAQKLKDNEFRDYRVGILHGKMKNDEKQTIMESFIKGELEILVSTTVIEVGVDVPNATVMLIENAEMFGLSQLHQLRGRVGRGKDKGYCILVTDSKNAVTKERMKVMQKTSNGFEISDTDLRLRGPGEFFGTKQHGIPMLKIANLYKDMDILKEAQKSAMILIEMDKNLEDEENLLLKDKTKNIFLNKEIGM